MSWRSVVVSSRAKLEYKLGYLVIRHAEETRKVYLQDVSVLVIENTGCSLTAALLEKLWENKTCVIFCDSKRNPGAQLIPYYGSHDTSLKVLMQSNWTEEIKAKVWKIIVKDKIYFQSKCLDKLDKTAAEKVSGYILEVEDGDITNREGHAAKVYFNALFGKDFSRNNDIPINGALNYGYSILLSAINREIVANGYVTQLGVFHRNRFNELNLGCDLMEPFRPIVDYYVSSNKIGDELTKELKHGLVDLLNKDVSVSGIRTTLLNSFSIYVKSILDALSEENLDLIRTVNYEF